MDRIVVRADEPIGRISPRVYGHFAEHLGRCCYDGLWDGTAFRQDVVAALRRLPVPLLRWPGGCYADHYHWRDGIGPPEDRPRRLGMSCGLQVEDDNSLGTHEFLELCRDLGAEAYVAGNVGSGTPQELADWLEYCNSDLDTQLTRERKANGRARPFGVRLWGVGNENWGCGGNFDPVGYAREYSRFATMLHHVDPSAELVVCGHDDAWNALLLETLSKRAHLADHLSIHRYWSGGGPETAFSDDQYYALLDEAAQTEAFIERTAQIISETLPVGRRVGIALDEWGVWHPEARTWPPRAGVKPRLPVTYEQAGTLRDALAAGIALEGFHRQARVLTMANLAQTVNVLHAVVMTDGARMWCTPTYWTLHLHKPHMGATALAVEASDSVTATASRTDGGMAVTVINRDLHRDAEVCVEAHAPSLTSVRARLLTAPEANASNSGDEPECVRPTELAAVSDGGGVWRLDLPRHSLATLVLSP